MIHTRFKFLTKFFRHRFRTSAQELRHKFSIELGAEITLRCRSPQLGVDLTPVTRAEHRLPHKSEELIKIVRWKLWFKILFHSLLC